MSYEVPQYIETEDKIVGPLTLRQFIYLALGVVLDFLLYVFLNFFIWFILAIPITLLAVAFAFYKPGGQKFERLFIAAFNWFLGVRYFFWQRKEFKKSIEIKDLDYLLKEKKEIIKNKQRNLSKKVYKVDEVAKMLDKE